jgi:hypothetical protein
MIGTRKQVDSPDAGRREVAGSSLSYRLAVENSGTTGNGKRRGPMLSETHNETSALITSKARGTVNLNLVVLRVIKVMRTLTRNVSDA